jgi:hypothetical protein
MIPNFTFLDPTLFSIFEAGSVTFEFSDDGSHAVTFLSGRHGPASGWQDFSAWTVTFDTGSHTVSVPSHGTHTEEVGAAATFQNGTYLFALVDGGTFAHDAATAASFGTGTHFLCAVVTDYGTEQMPVETTFFDGAHNEIAVGPVVTEQGTVITTFGSGSLYNALPDVDPLADKAIIRFEILPGSTAGVLEYTGQGNPVAYNTDYLEDHYVIVDTPNGDSIIFDIPWNGTSFDNRYQLIFDAPTFPNPPGAPPGIVIIDNGTGTNVGSLPSEPASFGIAFYNGTYAQIVVSGSIPRDTVPNFCTFLFGSHTFVQQSGSVVEDHGLVSASFGTGDHIEMMLIGTGTDHGGISATFYNGAHEIVASYVVADTTEVTADDTSVLADNCKPFSADRADYVTFDDGTVFNFSQL